MVGYKAQKSLEGIETCPACFDVCYRDIRYKAQKSLEGIETPGLRLYVTHLSAGYKAQKSLEGIETGFTVVMSASGVPLQSTEIPGRD